MNYDTNKYYAYEIEDFFEFSKNSITSDVNGKHQNIKHKLHCIVNYNISGDIMDANSEKPVFSLDKRSKESLKFTLQKLKEARRFCKSFLNSNSTISFFSAMRDSYLNSKYSHYSYSSYHNISKSEQFFRANSSKKILEEYILYIEKTILAFKKALKNYNDNKAVDNVESIVNTENNLISNKDKNDNSRIRKIERENKIKNLKIKKVLKLKKGVLVKEQEKFLSQKSNSHYTKLNEYYQRSLNLIEEFGTNISYEELISKMLQLRNSVAQSIVYYLTLAKQDSDLSALSKYNINWLIETFEKVYIIFEKNMKKLKKEERSHLIEKFKKENNFETFLITDLTKEKMISAANKKIVRLMMEESHFYSKDSSRMNSISNLSPEFLIARNAEFMTLEEVGELYNKMNQELNDKSAYFPYDDYQLQQNFIIAIYILMKQRKIINEEQELTDSLRIEICNKYLHSSLKVKAEEKEEEKQY